MNNNDPFAPVDGATRRTSKSDTADWEIIVPVPPGAKPAPGKSRILGKPTKLWTYTDAEGQLLGYVARFDGPDGKEFRPLTFWRSSADSATSWRWTSWPAPRPLYGLRRLAERPSAPVMVTEGEKASDAAARLLLAFAAITSPNGSKSCDKADWSPLRSRSVTIWPDADAAGLAFAKAVARAAAEAGAASVAIIAPPKGVPVGWDAADAESAGWDEKRAAELVASAAPANGEAGPRPRRKRQRDDVIGAVINTEGVELWRDPGGATYATVPVNGHAENWSLRSFGLERWVSGLYYRKTGVALPGQALEDIRRTLDIKAYEDGHQYEPFVRVGESNGHIYLDLCDDAWRAVEITAKGWRVIDRPAIKFLRSASARPLPEPEAGDMIERLRGFINVANEDDFKLIVSWLVAALRPGSPFPILIVNGIQGTGKSVLCRLLRSLIDPDIAMICAAPKDERDLVFAASNTWVQRIGQFERRERVSSRCSLSSRQRRGLSYSLAAHQPRRVGVFGAAADLAQRHSDADRASRRRPRSLVINLAGIPPERRQAESDFWMEFESVRGRILGSLLEGVSRALSAIDSIKVDRPGSMADFEKWSMAAAPAFGWKAGEFQTAYRKNQAVVVDDTFEADAVAVAIKDFIMRNHPEDGGKEHRPRCRSNWTRRRLSESANRGPGQRRRPNSAIGSSERSRSSNTRDSRSIGGIRARAQSSLCHRGSRDVAHRKGRNGKAATQPEARAILPRDRARRQTSARGLASSPASNQTERTTTSSCVGRTSRQGSMS